MARGAPKTPVALRRRLSLTVLTLYGLGTTVGAGIYALIGKVAGAAGTYAPVSFLLAALLAGFTALSFTELSARFPKSAGEAVYVREGLRSPSLAVLVGLLVVLAGCVSSAAISIGAVGYIRAFITLAPEVGLILVVGLIGIIAAWGILESALAAAVMTLLEIGGLALVITSGLISIPDLAARLPEVIPPFEALAWNGILAGSLLAFYAFIGFEDMVNVAEEVKDVRRTLPLAIVLTLVLTTAVYLLLSVVAVIAMPPAELAASEAPLALLYERTRGEPATVIGLIAIVATLNGAMVQIIMAARVLYGLAQQGTLPALLGQVNRLTHTPLAATALVVVVILVFGLLFPIETLARGTSAVALVIFTLVNLSLLAVKRRGPPETGIATVPLAVPALGILVTFLFFVLELRRLLA